MKAQGGRMKKDRGVALSGTPGSVLSAPLPHGRGSDKMQTV